MTKYITLKGPLICARGISGNVSSPARIHPIGSVAVVDVQLETNGRHVLLLGDDGQVYSLGMIQCNLRRR